MTHFNAAEFAVAPLRPFKDGARPFGADDQWNNNGPWPIAHLVIKTQNSVYVVNVEGGSSQTIFKLAYTSNETAAHWEGRYVTLGTHGSVEHLITEVIYGRAPIKALEALQQLVGKRYQLTFEDRRGAYGFQREVVGEWLITAIQSIELRVGYAR